MIRKIILLIIIKIVLISCKEEVKYNNQNYTSLDTNKINIVKNSESLLDLFQYTKKIELELNDSCLVGQISNIIYSEKDSLLFVHDSANDKIYKFTQEGKYINTIGSKGQGPEEYDGISSLFLENNNILIIDKRLALIIYDKTGKFISKHIFRHKIKANIAKLFYKDNNVLIYSSSSLIEKSDHSLTVYNILTGEIENKIGNSIINYIPFFGLYPTILDNKYFIYSLPADKNIYQINIHNGEEKIFSKINDMMDVPEKLKFIKNLEELFSWFDKNGIDLLSEKFLIDAIYEVNKFLIFRNNQTTFDIFDANGTQLHQNMKLVDSDTRNNIEKYNLNNIDVSRSLYFYSKGFVMEGYDEKRVKKELINPTLLFFEMKEK